MMLLGGSYDYRLVALSIVLALLASYAALEPARRVTAERGLGRFVWFLGAAAIGLGIWAMQYVAMLTVTTRVAHDRSMVGVSLLVAISASGVALFVLILFFAERYMAIHKAGLNPSRERELYFQTMAEAVPEMIWTSAPDGMSDFFNQRCLEYTGLTLEQMQGTGWKVIIHPDDLSGIVSVWEDSLQTGNSFDGEYRLRAKDGTFRSFLVRANPVRNSDGKIIKWFGSG